MFNVMNHPWFKTKQISLHKTNFGSRAFSVGLSHHGKTGVWFGRDTSNAVLDPTGLRRNEFKRVSYGWRCIEPSWEPTVAARDKEINALDGRRLSHHRTGDGHQDVVGGRTYRTYCEGKTTGDGEDMLPLLMKCTPSARMYTFSVLERFPLLLRVFYKTCRRVGHIETLLEGPVFPIIWAIWSDVLDDL